MDEACGKTLWGKEWLRKLDNIYKGTGFLQKNPYVAVTKVSINSKNLIIASVKTGRPRAYQVNLHVEEFSQEQRKAITATLEQSMHLLNQTSSVQIDGGQVENSTLPEELYQLLTNSSISLFPENSTQIQGSCTCPEKGFLCDHIKALMHGMTRVIDNDPALAFHLRGFNIANEVEQAKMAQLKNVYTPPTVADIINNSGLEQFDIMQPAPNAPLDYSTIPDLQKKICLLLKPNPYFFDQDFRNFMQKGYEVLQDNMREELLEYNNLLATQEGREKVTETFFRRYGQPESWLIVTLTVDYNYDFRVRKNNQTLHESADFFVGMLLSITPALLSRCSQTIKMWHAIYHFTLRLMEKAAIVPQLLHCKNGTSTIRWVPALFDPHVKALFNRLCESCPPLLVKCVEKKSANFLSAAEQVQIACSFFISLSLHHTLRLKIATPASQQIANLFYKNSAIDFSKFEKRDAAHHIVKWLSHLHPTSKPYQISLVVTDNGTNFILEPLIELKMGGAQTHKLTVKQLLEQKPETTIYLQITEDFEALGNYIHPFKGILNGKEAAAISYNTNDFTNVFLNIFPLVAAMGVNIILPDGLKEIATPEIELALAAHAALEPLHQTFISLDKLLTFDWKVAIGNHRIGIREFKKLLKTSSGMVRIQERYIILDNQTIEQLSKRCEQLPSSLSSVELLQAGLAGSVVGNKITANEHVEKLFSYLTEYRPARIPPDLNATLRPYQERGFGWLVQNMTMGIGSIIADDMGLGKTIQVIAAILHFKNLGALHQKKVLVVAPTSVLSNWQHEIMRFAPALKSTIYHGQQRKLELDSIDVLITSYGHIRSDQEEFEKIEWFLIVIDEAQNIKNPLTAQTKAIKALTSHHKIAMSGTPVENRLLEYWSIFDFAYKHFLGSAAQFSEVFARPIEKERDLHSLERFTKITRPFMLRRLKTDKNIISDLPDKVENDQYCNLTPEQAALYQAVVNATFGQIKSAEGITRKGLVFKLLTALKQICNHPYHYTKKQHAMSSKSGKMQMLEEILTNINELGEKTLIFTQYVEMGELLSAFIKEHFKQPAPFLHGGLSVRQRNDLVQDFQNNSDAKILIVSLRAGGTGLNLTAASHVIHYDLWWNPAVEAQATDRAYRIGQSKNVMVYRLITSNTFEERINDMLKSKRALAHLTISSGEQWITELGNDQLRDLFALK